VEVSSNGRTVWVNNVLGCVARFCPSSQEYLRPNQCIETISHPGRAPTVGHWELFCRTVKERFGVTVRNNHRPRGVYDQ
jgi:hypothetical protein